jgi:hypothetical protein
VSQREEQQDATSAEVRVGDVRIEVAVRLDVREHEHRRVRTADERDPCQASDGAARTVAPNEEPRTHELGFAAASAKGTDHVIVLWFERDELGASLHRDASGGESLVQHALGLGLREEEQERIRGVLEPDVEQPKPLPVSVRAELKLDGGAAELHQLVGHAEAPKDLQ